LQNLSKLKITTKARPFNFTLTESEIFSPTTFTPKNDYIDSFALAGVLVYTHYARIRRASLLTANNRKKSTYDVPRNYSTVISISYIILPCKCNKNL